MARFTVSLKAKGMLEHDDTEVTVSLNGGMVQIALLGYPLSTMLGTYDLAGLLDLWVELGMFLDEVVPGATGLRPLPDGESAAVQELQAEVALRRMERGAQ